MLQRPEVEMRHLAMHMDDDIGFLVRAVRHIGGGNVRDRREAGVKLLAQPPFLGLQLRKTRLQCRNFFHQRACRGFIALRLGLADRLGSLVPPGQPRLHLGLDRAPRAVEIEDGLRYTGHAPPRERGVECKRVGPYGAYVVHGRCLWPEAGPGCKVKRAPRQSVVGRGAFNSEPIMRSKRCGYPVARPFWLPMAARCFCWKIAARRSISGWR